MAATIQTLVSEGQTLLFGEHLNASKPKSYILSKDANDFWSYDYLLFSMSSFSTPARVCLFIMLLLLPFAATYIITSLLFKATRWSNVRGRRAPLVPYSIPVVGHAMAFAFSVADLIQDNLHLCANELDNYSPIRFKGMNVELSFISGPKNVFSLFRQSRKFSAKASVVIAIDRLFGTPKHLVPSFYDHDDTGYDGKPDSGSRDVAPHLRIHHTVHVQVIKYLSGSGLKPMTNKLMENIAKTMLSSGIGGVWLEMEDLFDFCKSKLLHASINSMFGEYLTALHPDFVDDYWKFDDCTTTLVKGFPSFMVPRSWAARRKCLDSLKHWKAYVEKLVDADGRTFYEGLDPHFGSQFIRQRHEGFNKMEPMNADSIASEDLAIMWAANSNAIPAAYWFLYEIFRDPELLGRGTVDDPHPLNQFWAERFLLKTGSDHSGPLLQSYRKKHVDIPATTRPELPVRVDSAMEDSAVQPEVKYSTNGLAGAWVPYGGGQSLCPGRHYAKQEMLMTFAIMSTCFDIEILQEPGEVTLPDLGYFGLGVLPPKNKTRCRIRRRTFRKDSVVE
ncbi:cytochrome P450 [Aureobasidium pullulans]|uniref:Cytochrome P450 n=1 Tax=Aureobasidium pullulans TaxID=5580 RepID=A0A4S9SQK0_AURPU|nr:cytochrome P450 [Aureobasidium pullulans]